MNKTDTTSDPDETEGRKLYRKYASGRARYDIAMGRIRRAISLGAIVLLASCSDPSITTVDQAHGCTDSGGKLTLENIDNLSPTSAPVYLGCEHDR
jgi:hypothetical protein